MRSNNRSAGELRPFSVNADIQPQAYASLLIKTGNTHVICAVSLEGTSARRFSKVRAQRLDNRGIFHSYLVPLRRDIGAKSGGSRDGAWKFSG